MKAPVKTGAKGLALEEVLKGYFSRSGYVAIRGVPYRLDGEEVTDIDLWLYERPGAATRRRIIVDIKNKRSPKAAERIIWTKGLQAAIGVDTAIVATSATSPTIKRLAKAVGVVLLDGQAIEKLTSSDQQPPPRVSLDSLEMQIRQIDKGRESAQWMGLLDKARASLVTGFGVQSANQSLAAAAYFAEQAVIGAPGTLPVAVAIRLVYLTATFVALSLDFVMADHAFKSQEERRRVIMDGLRFGQSDTVPAVATISAAIGLVRQYAENGAALAKQIEEGVYADAERIPSEILADYMVKVTRRDTVFTAARELEDASLRPQVPSFDQLGPECKAFLGALLDFNGVARERFAEASGAARDLLAQSKRHEGPSSAGPLFGGQRGEKRQRWQRSSFGMI